ncbi:hypothetical protein OKA04_14840 [Luteolibacter flavescens]|uniref:Transmembrane protein n=1 Tax=Luteolibacter flavescens TaxID=1859460 RepID=A0ABT3FRD1_9BACT|nr:hypothetical protein [Luteolibacter flavescens]MCW1886012.1 hypothetical protein [Luteolibacter flavescens]
MNHSTQTEKSGWKKRWEEFKQSRPGHRFQDRHRQNRERHFGRSPFVNALQPAAGILLIVAGVVFCVIPGPGLPLLLIGLAMIADVSLWVAVRLDRFELWLRSVLPRRKPSH